jgi:NAD(P)-dependent dehydrogenase (short-subunit alcohol dehydrogenase family)
VSGSVTVVTGGGSGIGAALCRRLAAPGERLVVHTGSRREKAEAVADELRAKGAEALVVVESFADPARAAGVVERAVTEWGRLDRLVHLAGFADRRPLGVLDAAGFEASMAANATAFFHLATAALPALRRSEAGRIVAAGSFLAHRVRFGADMLFPATTASKAAVAGLVRALAMQLAPEGITVNCIVPGFVEKEADQHTALDPAARARVTALVPMGRFGRREEIAAAVAFLLGKEAGYITGQTIHVDGGVTL